MVSRVVGGIELAESAPYLRHLKPADKDYKR